MSNPVSNRESDVGDRREAGKVGVPLRHVVFSFLVFFISAALLNGRHLYEAASLRPYGPTRAVWMAITRPLNTVSCTLRLDRLRAKFETFQEE